MSETLFIEDRKGGFQSPHDESSDSEPDNIASSEKATEKNIETITNERTTVWEDEDDKDRTVDLLAVPRRKKLRKALAEKEISQAEYTRRLRELQTGLPPSSKTGPGAWAQLPAKRATTKQQKEDDDSDEDDPGSDIEPDLPQTVRSLLQSTGRILSKRKRSRLAAGESAGYVLRPGVLDLRILAHANQEEPNEAEARCVEFHPSGCLMLTAGLDKTLRLFQIDGEKNPKVQGIHLNRFLIRSAKFTAGGNEIVMTGRKKYYYQYDLNSGQITQVKTLQQYDDISWEKFTTSADGEMLAFLGREGKIILAANKSKREIGQLRHNERVISAAFAPEGQNQHHIYSTTETGTIYLWDARKMSCVHRHKDEGAIHSTSLAVSNDYYALGSDSGIVNVYPSSTMTTRSSTKSEGFVFRSQTEKPYKTFYNLTTEIDNIAFNPDGQIMAFSSHEKKGAIRLVHTKSMTTFTNWPTSRTNIHRVSTIAFSPGGGYLAVGNEKGDVHLLRLKDYPAR